MDLLSRLVHGCAHVKVPVVCECSNVHADHLSKSQDWSSCLMHDEDLLVEVGPVKLTHFLARFDRGSHANAHGTTETTLCKNRR